MRHFYNILTLFALLIVEAGYGWTYTQDSQKTFKSLKIDQIDSNLIGQELDKVMTMLQVDSTHLSPFDEPPMILRGVWGTLPDSTELVLYVDRTWGDSYKTIKNRKIIGLAWADTKGNTRYLGQVIPYYEVTNEHYHKKNKK